MPITRRHLIDRMLLFFLASGVGTGPACSALNFADVTAFGAKGDGRHDDTSAIARAHATGRPVLYPRPKRFYRIAKTINVTSDIVGDASEVRLHQDGTSDGIMFRIGKTPGSVTISGMILDGGYKTGTAGEFSHGISLIGANHVTIRKNTIRNVYGDCIYVASRSAKITSRHIVIEDNVLANPRRCNVAITSGEHVTVRRNMISKQSSFVAAIDIEPNDNGFDKVRDVSIIANVYDVKNYFLMVTTLNFKHQVPVTHLLVKSNKGQAKYFFRAYAEAKIVSPIIIGNSFTANTRDGRMFMFSEVKDAVLSGNVDKTLCVPLLYESNDIRDSSIKLESANHFCRR